MKSKGYIQAKSIKLNDELNIIVFTKNVSSYFSKVVKISVKVERGFIAPLTESGTLIINGIHVSCYAFSSHSLAHFVMKPIAYWYSLKKYLGYEEVESKLEEKRVSGSLHPFARFLMFLGLKKLEFLFI